MSKRHGEDEDLRVICAGGGVRSSSESSRITMLISVFPRLSTVLPTFSSVLPGHRVFHTLGMPSPALLNLDKRCAVSLLISPCRPEMRRGSADAWSQPRNASLPAQRPQKKNCTASLRPLNRAISHTRSPFEVCPHTSSNLSSMIPY